MRISLGSALLAASAYILKNRFFPSRISTAEAGTLAAYIDALIPTDNISPGALRFKVPDKILAAARADKKLRRLIRHGTRWLTLRAWMRGVRGFPYLDKGARNEVVALSAEAPRGSLGRVFYDNIRHEAFFHYYAEPAAWAQAGYRGPPQPLGYQDHHRPYSYMPS